MLKTFAVLLLVTTGMLTFASAKAAVSCQAVADEVSRKGADATVRDLTSRTNGDWDQFIRQVGAGRAECVQAAAAVAPGADAGNHEGIIYGLSQALRENPKAVLMVSGGRISLENVCSDRAIEDSDAQHKAFMQRAAASVAQIREPSLRVKRDACLTALHRQ
ncbi:MAG TPA: hypothetical protein VF402_09460 [Asticcacaulis sp.]